MLSQFSEYIYTLFRIIIGFLFACHGAQKLFGVLGGQAEMHAPIYMIAGIIEFGGGVLVLLGFFASAAAFFASGEMAVAYFWRHAPNGFWPILNKGELAVLYCFAFIYIAARGSGMYSVDHILLGKQHVRSHLDD